MIKIVYLILLDTKRHLFLFVCLFVWYFGGGGIQIIPFVKCLGVEDHSILKSCNIVLRYSVKQCTEAKMTYCKLTIILDDFITRII